MTGRKRRCCATTEDLAQLLIFVFIKPRPASSLIHVKHGVQHIHVVELVLIFFAVDVCLVTRSAFEWKSKYETISCQIFKQLLYCIFNRDESIKQCSLTTHGELLD